VVLDASDKKFEEAKEAHPDGYVVTDAATRKFQRAVNCLAFYEDDPRDNADSL